MPVENLTKDSSKSRLNIKFFHSIPQIKYRSSPKSKKNNENKSTDSSVYLHENTDPNNLFYDCINNNADYTKGMNFYWV